MSQCNMYVYMYVMTIIYQYLFEILNKMVNY